jgi:hypothetical protein
MILNNRLIQLGSPEIIIEFYYTKDGIEQRNTSRYYIPEKNENPNSAEIINKYRGIYLIETQGMYI